MGREREKDNRKATEDERQVPDIHSDYTFMGDEKEGKPLACLAREAATRVVLRTAVPRKSTKAGGMAS